jgi:Peptidase family M23/Abnormal spindle-like microcephaly-assoc'd, ASPM-SPD-2-Hydin
VFLFSPVTSPPPTPVLSATPASLDFLTVTVGTSKDLTFTVQNTGGGTLAGSASTSAPFSIVGDNSFGLTANQTKTITVRFAPTAAATVNGNVSITSNGGNGSVLLTGIGVTTKKLVSGRISIGGNFLQDVIVVRLDKNLALKEKTKTDAKGEYFFLTFASDDYIIPISSGRMGQTPNSNDGVHGYEFSPSFCVAGAKSRACGGKGQTLVQDFSASLKPSLMDPQVVLKMPLPSGSWPLSVEAGGYAFVNNQVDADPSHTDLSSGFYALDFPGTSGTSILAALGGNVAAVFCNSSSPTKLQIQKGCNEGFGWNIILSHGGSFNTRYTHLREKPTLAVGDPVQQGQVVGCMGSTGLSTGSHLHFQIYNGGFTSAFSQSSSTELARIRIETSNGSLPVIEFLAGASFQSTNVITNSSACSN